jgi:hypothetical protein
MKKNAVAVLLLLGCAGAAYGQLRTIPEDAKRGTMRHVQEMTVEIDGTQQQLAAGAQIRDADNRIVVPSAVPPGTLVKYRLDGDGRVWRVWFLTPEEAAQTDPTK